MAKAKHLSVLLRGTDTWNEWRKDNPHIQPDLSGANLHGIELERANLSCSIFRRLSPGKYLKYRYKFPDGLVKITANLCGTDLSAANLKDANLRGADLCGAYLREANLSNANLGEANLRGADLTRANLTKVNLAGAVLYGADLNDANLAYANLHRASLRGASFFSANLNRAGLSMAFANATYFLHANLSEANLTGTDFTGADLKNANLDYATTTGTNFENSRLESCRIYGISAWNLRLRGARQADLIIEREGEQSISVDNIEVAQFVYLLMNNERISNALDTIAYKLVLILGRFTSERKEVLESLREALRKRGYVPVVFDFKRPAKRDLTETISAIAHMSYFVIADITKARSVPHELKAIVPNLPSVPVQPILESQCDSEYGMFEHIRRFPWVLEPYLYKNIDEAILGIDDKIIGPAETKAKDQRR